MGPNGVIIGPDWGPGWSSNFEVLAWEPIGGRRARLPFEPQLRVEFRGFCAGRQKAASDHRFDIKP